MVCPILSSRFHFMDRWKPNETHLPRPALTWPSLSPASRRVEVPATGGLKQLGIWRFHWLYWKLNSYIRTDGLIISTLHIGKSMRRTFDMCVCVFKCIFLLYILLWIWSYSSKGISVHWYLKKLLQGMMQVQLVMHCRLPLIPAEFVGTNSLWHDPGP